MSNLIALNKLPIGFTETTTLITQLDQAFMTGFARLGQAETESLASLARIFTGTPLSDCLQASYEAMTRSEFVITHFVSLAAARTALQGAQFDLLQEQAREALHRSVVSQPIPEAQIAKTELAETGSSTDVWLESTQHWLMEIALAGFGQLDAQTLIPFLTTLAQMQAEPQLVSLASLLTGFLHELLQAVPLLEPSQAPLYRWVDLWSRAMIASMPSPARPQPTPVSGTLHLLGLELYQHAHFVSTIAHGVLRQEDEPTDQCVRITLSSYKVGAIRGDEIWLLFPEMLPLFESLSKGKALHLSNMLLLASGDLLWPGEAALGATFDPMGEAERLFAIEAEPQVTPYHRNAVERHPIQLAEPIFLSGYTVITTESIPHLTWADGATLPIATARMSGSSGISIEAIAKSNQLFGLLRFDAGQWAVQPLTIATKKGKSKAKCTFVGQQAEKLLKKPPKQSTVSTLQERASRLLRK